MSSAIELLKADHKTVRKLLGDLVDTKERALKTRTQLLIRLGRELRAHGAIEEDIFYPALREAAEQAGDKEVLRQVAEAYEEHRAAVQLVLADLEATEAGSIQFSGRAKVLKEFVEHHAHEEEKQMFKDARRLLDKDTLKALGATMQERKTVELSGAGPLKPGVMHVGHGKRAAASSAQQAAS